MTRTIPLTRGQDAGHLEPLLDVSRWVGVPVPEIPFAVADLVPVGMVTLLVAPGGAGKSLLQQLAITCPAIGHPFLGRNTAGGSGAGIFAEDPDAVLHLRQERINEALGVTMEEIVGRVFPVSMAGQDATLWRDGRPTGYLGQLEQQLADVPELRVIALDNAALLFAGDESDRGDVTRFINALAGVATRLGAGLILSTHTSKTHSSSNAALAASGSTAWPWACRSVIELKAGDNPERPTLDLIKANHAKPGQVIPLRWHDRMLHADEQPTGLVGGITRAGVQRVFLDLLDRAAAQGRPISHNSRAANYGPKLFDLSPDSGGHTKKSFEKAMEALLARGTIKIEEYGRKGDARRQLVREPDQPDDAPTTEGAQL